MSVIITGEYVALLVTSHDNVLKNIRNDDAGCTRHGVKESRKEAGSQVVNNVPLAGEMPC